MKEIYMIESGHVLVGVGILLAVYATGVLARRQARIPVAVRARKMRRRR